MNAQKVKPGIWRHYKGGLYEVLYCATHTETEEELVVYRSLQGERKVWVRPASMWFDIIPASGGVQRFTFLGTSDCKRCENPGCALRDSDWTPDPAVVCYGYEPRRTKGDMLRSKTNEELADWLVMIEERILSRQPMLERAALKADWLCWLNQEAKDG